MIRGVLYLRVSYKKQLDGVSLETQEDVGKKYCANNHITIVRIFIEKGESAKYEDRTELQAAIKFCATEKIDVFAFYKFDRYSRNTLNHLHLKAIFSKYGTKIVSISEPIPDNAAGRFMETVIAAANQFDNELKSERVVDNMKYLLNQGYWLFQDPIGYKKEGEKSKDDRGYLVPKPNEFFEPVQEGWNMLKSGLLPRTKVVDYLNEWGVRTQRGNKISEQTAHKTYTNIFYAGIIESKKFGIFAQGKHQKMITEADFYYV